jgi:hypothetical protein
MAWTTPETRAAGDILSAAKWNEQVRDNENYLFSGRPKFSIFRDNGADYSTSSTSFVDVDGTNLKGVLTISGSAVLLGFNCVCASTGGGTTLAPDFDFSIDGVRAGAAGADGLARGASLTIYVYPNVGLVALVTGLSVGSHTFKIVWKANAAATVSMYAGSGVGGADFIPHFWGIEVA